MIFPLDGEGRIYVLHDDKGNIIGTGSREVCEMLLVIIKKAAGTSSVRPYSGGPTSGADIRSAVKL